VKKPGLVVIEFMEAIPPGLEKAEFAALLQERIETVSARLAREGIAQEPPPLPADAPQP
jgi:1-acyl-sn-glycerol-3-phosphate acyltransferase